jgi:hypothetical protein
MPKQRKKAVAKKTFFLPFPTTRSVVKNPTKRATGGCLDAIPTSVYRATQQYLLEREYRDFMNTSLSIFQTVKFETVYYNLLGPEKWLYSGAWTTEEQENFVTTIINHCVKDKSKQISVSFSQATQEKIFKHLHLFADIHKVTIAGRPGGVLYPFWVDDFPLQYFSNLSHVVLMNIGLPDRHFKGLPNVQKLELLDCAFASFEMANPTNSLTYLRVVKHMFQLQLPSSLENISFVEINGFLKELPILGNNKSFTLIPERCVLSLSDFNQMNQPRFHANLQYLKLHCEFPVDFTDFSFTQYMAVVDLHCMAGSKQNCMVPVLTSTVIKLCNFNLQLWNNQILPNARKVWLKTCFGIQTLPSMPWVRELSLLYHFKQPNEKTVLEEVPSCATLRKLIINTCPDIGKIGDYPVLKERNINGCPKLPK